MEDCITICDDDDVQLIKHVVNLEPILIDLTESDDISEEPQTASNPPHPDTPFSQQPQCPFSQQPQSPFSQQPQSPFSQQPQSPFSKQPQSPFNQQPQTPFSQQPHTLFSQPSYPTFSQPSYPTFSQQPDPSSSQQHDPSSGQHADSPLSQQTHSPSSRRHDTNLGPQFDFPSRVDPEPESEQNGYHSSQHYQADAEQNTDLPSNHNTPSDQLHDLLFNHPRNAPQHQQNEPSFGQKTDSTFYQQPDSTSTQQTDSNTHQQPDPSPQQQSEWSSIPQQSSAAPDPQRVDAQKPKPVQMSDKELMMHQKALGNEKYKHNLLDDAIRIYKRANELARKLGEKEMSAILHFNLAMTYYRLGSYEQAIDECAHAVKINDNYMKAHLKRAEIYQRQCKFEEAVICYEHICELDSNNQDYVVLLNYAKEKAKKTVKKDCFQILGLKHNFTQEELKKAYRQQALSHHPDRHSDADIITRRIEEKQFKDASEAHTYIQRYGYRR